MQGLIKEYILSALAGGEAEVPLEALDDAGIVKGIILKSDSYTVKPLFFPGGDIGRLAVSGTVNDIAVMGGRPLALASAFVFEEGFALSDLERVLKSMASTCREAGVSIVTGDTKVVERGALDQLVVNLSGVGVASPYLEENLKVVATYRPHQARWLVDSAIRPGDKLILSGTIGDHGVAILSAREGYGFEADVASDAKPLNHLIEEALKVGGVVAAKDPTRGGLANLLNEWVEKSGVGIRVYEDRIPVREPVRAACEMLGIDYLELGNEGKVVLAVVADKAEAVLEAIRRVRGGEEAAIIGEATDEFDMVVMETLIGGRRIIAPPAGDPVPRIC
jgi:hydrogenase expression/formation protein HypE